MENINLYDLAFAFSQHEDVGESRIVDGMCPDDTVLVEFIPGEDAPVATFGVQDGYPAVALGTLYANADDWRAGVPLETGIHHDFEGEDDYGDGVDDLVAQCAGASKE